MRTGLIIKILPAVVLGLNLLSCSKRAELGSDQNLIVLENKNEGTTDWLIDLPYKTCEYPDHQNCRRENIEGYCSHTSIKANEKLSIFASTNPESDYDLSIYRMGYYGGKGLRLMI